MGVDQIFKCVLNLFVFFWADLGSLLRRRCHIKSDLVEFADNRQFRRKGFQRLSLLVDRLNCANFT